MPHEAQKCQLRSLAFRPYFKKMGIRDRREVAKKLRVCFVCLSQGHSATSCRNSIKCKLCSSLHHELLCGSVRNDQNFIIDQVIENEELGEAINDFDHEWDIFVNEGDNLDYEGDTTDNVEVEQQVDDLIDL